jgi:hypothetical protein
MAKPRFAACGTLAAKGGVVGSGKDGRGRLTLRPTGPSVETPGQAANLFLMLLCSKELNPFSRFAGVRVILLGGAGGIPFPNVSGDPRAKRVGSTTLFGFVYGRLSSC